MFPNDEVVAYGRANGLGSDYNDIMTAFLRDYYSSNLSLTDLWGRAWAEGYRSINGFTDFPGIANSEFYAPLTSSLILTRGTGDPTFTRATVAWEFDNEGKLILVPSGAARFGGARMVRNIVPTSENFSLWTIVNATITANTTVAPDGTTTADTITANTNSGYVTHWSAVTYYGSVVRVRVKKGVGSRFSVCTGGFGANDSAIFDLDNYTVVSKGANNSSASITSIGNYWYLCEVIRGISENDIVYIGFLDSGATPGDYHYIWGAQNENVTGQADKTASEYVSVGVLSAPYHGAGVDGVKWFDTNKDGSAIAASSLLGYHAEGARTNSLLYSRNIFLGGSANETPWMCTSGFGVELLSNGDAEIDSGWRGFSAPTLQERSSEQVHGGTYSRKCVSSAYPQGLESPAFVNTGNAIVVTVYVYTTSATAVFIGLMTGTGTNGAYKSYALTPGSWTQIKYWTTNPITGADTRVRIYAATADTIYVDDVSVKEAAIQVTTCTGIDNAANSASTLTAGAADATILQTLTLAAAARSFSAYVRRRTGTGSVYITRDGGTSWTDITSSLGASWTRVKIENTSVLNPSVGFKIATSGDAIDVDCVQDEAGASISSPIITTTAAVTRNADAETFQTASNWSDTAGWALATVQGESWANATGTAIGDGTNGLKLSASNSGIVAYDGTNTVNGPAGSPSGAKKLAMTWGSGALQAASGGVAGSAGSYDGAWGLATVGIGTSQGNVYIKNVYIGQSALTADQLQQVTA